MFSEVLRVLSQKQSFKNRYTLQQRKSIYAQLLKEYITDAGRFSSDYVLVVVEPLHNLFVSAQQFRALAVHHAKTLALNKKSKVLRLLESVKKLYGVRPTQNVFLAAGGSMLVVENTIGEVYESRFDPDDGFLYVKIIVAEAMGA